MSAIGKYENIFHENTAIRDMKIRDMKIHKACASDIYVGAGCIRSTSLRKTPYLVWVLSTDGKDIMEGL